ncbi:Nucleotidyltransferase domain protein [Candidatus Magnetobacterium bavaricum]|uniref:Nucleotidyltransferase domain protein n=1 Tax=Candidatus Magnetobacterium bavaricum TaxID=29290 RepID=A0A0F3GWC9_9BACT|nr:Nucleotidyltransferase domain protein [Candidatus Magnetobacterium bavaricum]
MPDGFRLTFGIFGSYARGQQKRRSDIDILVEFSGDPGFIGFMRLDELRKLLGVRVDLVTKEELRMSVLRTLLTAVLVCLSGMPAMALMVALDTEDLTRGALTSTWRSASCCGRSKGILFIFHGKRKKEGGSAPSSDLPRKGTSPLDPILLCFFKRIRQRRQGVILYDGLSFILYFWL